MIATLFSFRIRHDYFAGGGFDGFDLAPLGTTAQSMRRLGMRMYRVGGRWLLSCDVAGKLRDYVSYLVECQGVKTLTFSVRAETSYFYAITRIPDEGRLPFSANTAVAEEAGHGVIEVSPNFNAGLVLRDGEIGRLDVDLCTLKVDGAQPVEFATSFSAREVGWRYYVISRRGTDLREPFIKDRRDVLLDGPQAVTLRNGEPALRFDSGGRVFPLRQYPELIFDLYERDSISFQTGAEIPARCLMKGLPTPDAKGLSIEPDQVGESVFGAMFVYV